MTIWDQFATTDRDRAAQPVPNPQDWRAMQERDFDHEAKPQPLALFPEPDRTGTPDLFDTTETDPVSCDWCGHAAHGAQDDGSGPRCPDTIACDTGDCAMTDHRCACPNW